LHRCAIILSQVISITVVSLAIDIKDAKLGEQREEIPKHSSGERWLEKIGEEFSLLTTHFNNTSYFSWFSVVKEA
jgi:hypothetical protein